MTLIENWRKLLVMLIVVSMGFIALELVLLEHYEEWQQWLPLAFLCIGLAVSAWVWLRQTPAAVKSLRLISILYLPLGALGVFFHIKSNIEFELELNPGIAGGKLLVETLTGAMPALAPGAMAQLGLLGLLVCYRHPALTRVDD